MASKLLFSHPCSDGVSLYSSERPWYNWSLIVSSCQFWYSIICLNNANFLKKSYFSVSALGALLPSCILSWDWHRPYSGTPGRCSELYSPIPLFPHWQSVRPGPGHPRPTDWMQTISGPPRWYRLLDCPLVCFRGVGFRTLVLWSFCHQVHKRPGTARLPPSELPLYYSP